jgi:hypothetical protein
VKEMIACAVLASVITKNTEELMRRFDNKLDSLRSAFGKASGNTGGRQARQATTAAFQLRTRGGILSLLPDNFCFPHSSSYDCWTQWNIGNLERSIPPSRSLASKEFQFLDVIPKEANKQRGQPGKHRANQRSASKQYSDLNFFVIVWKKQRNNEAWGVDTYQMLVR